MVLVRSLRSGIGVRDVERAGGFGDIREGEMNVASDGVVSDHSLGAGLGLDAIVVLFIVRSGIDSYSAEMAIEAVGAVEGDVVIGPRPWLLGVNLCTVIGEQPIIGEVLTGGDGVPARRQLGQDIVASVESRASFALVAEINEDLAPDGVDLAVRVEHIRQSTRGADALLLLGHRLLFRNAVGLLFRNENSGDWNLDSCRIGSSREIES